MPDDSTAATHRTFIVEPTSGFGEAIRYVLAMTIVASMGAGALVFAGRSPSNDEASEIDSAVLIDLPPAEASSQPASDSAEGPAQQAAQASVSRQAPQHVEPPKDPPKPVEEPRPEPLEKAVDEPPPPVLPNPAAVLERKQEEAPLPKPVAAPATQAQDEHAPIGGQTPTRTDEADSDEGQPHASAHAITLWQKSLMLRLETAKHLVGPASRPRGTVKIAFAIDSKGALASERVTQSSGSASLDRAALQLVKDAAPFPAPPVGSGDRNTSFVVPIRFR